MSAVSPASLAAEGQVIVPAQDGKKWPGPGWPTAAGLTPEQVANRQTAGFPDRYCMVTGERSGVFVIETDEKDGKQGGANLAAFLVEHGETLPAGRWMRTATGSVHYHFEYAVPEGHHIITKAGVLPGVDVRGDGGQVLAFDEGRTWEDGPIPAAPRCLLDLVTVPDRKAVPAPAMPPYAGQGDGTPDALAFLTGRLEAVGDAPAGEWNDSFHRTVYGVAGLVAAGELAGDAAWAAIEAVVDVPPYTADDWLPVLASSWAAGLGAPWSVEVTEVTVLPEENAAPSWLQLPDEEPAVPATRKRTPVQVRISRAELGAFETQLRAELLEARTSTVEDVLSRRPPAWLIRGFLQEGATAQLVGPFAGGKSLLTLHWCAELARKGKAVLYCAAEGRGGFNGRLRALMAEHGGSVGDLRISRLAIIESRG